MSNRAKVPRWMLMQSRLRWRLFVATILGLCYALTIFEPGYIFGTNDYWRYPTLDAAQYVMGALYYYRSGWHWPIFMIPNLGVPEGTNAIYVDCIPLLALPFKLLYSVTGIRFIYFGFWTVLCHALQGFAMALLLDRLRVRAWAVFIPMLLIGLMMPILLNRTTHNALCGHFIIVLALWGYFEMYTQKEFRWRVHIAWWALLVVALMVHVYLMAMCAGLFLITLVETGLRRRKWFLPAVSWCISMALLLLVMKVCGHLSAAQTVGIEKVSKAYSWFSMNLLAPFMPYDGGVFEKLFGEWRYDIRGGQYEGAVYLGLGALFIVLIALVFPKRVIRAMRRHPILILGLIGFTGYALSDEVYLGHRLVFQYPLHDWLSIIMNNFRVSGRFFWPVAYVMMLGAAGVTRCAWRRPVMYALLILAVIVQWVDTKDVRHAFREVTRKESLRALETDGWRDLLSAHRHLRQYPSFACHWDMSQGMPYERELEMLQLGAYAGIETTNSVYAARRNKDCAREERWKEGLVLEPETLYVFPGGEDVLEELRAAGIDLTHCRQFRFGYVCTLSWDELEASYELPGIRQLEDPEVQAGR